METKLRPADVATEDAYGYSLGLFGNASVVCAPEADPWETDSGKCYFYLFDGTIWEQATKVTALDHGSLEYFGRRVALDTGAVMGSGVANNFLGKVYHFGGCVRAWRMIVLHRSALRESRAPLTPAWVVRVDVQVRVLPDSSSSIRPRAWIVLDPGTIRAHRHHRPAFRAGVLRVRGQQHDARPVCISSCAQPQADAAVRVGWRVACFCWAHTAPHPRLHGAGFRFSTQKAEIYISAMSANERLGRLFQSLPVTYFYTTWYPTPGYYWIDKELRECGGIECV